MDLRKHYSTSIIRPLLSHRGPASSISTAMAFTVWVSWGLGGLGGGHGHTLRMRRTLDGQTKGLVLSILAQTHVSRILGGET